MNLPSLAGRYESPLLPLPGATAAVSVAHGRGCAPWLVRCVLVCQKAELTYLAGDEVDVLSLNAAATNNTNVVVVANAAQLTLAQRAAFSVPNKDGTGFTALTAANWRVKFYAQW